MTEKYLNLRSDTVTLPTKEMYDAIMECQLGDDNRQEDPTVNKLEKMAANMFEKESAILLTSGAMGNLVGVMVNTRPGDEIIMEQDAHIWHDEQGAFAAIGSVVAHLVKGVLGYPRPEDIENAIRPLNNVHKPKTALVCLENTHNHAGGTVLTAEQIDEVAEVAHRHNIPVHLDGARIFNASVKLGISVSRLTRNVDTVTFCLSKGLCCPAGAIFLGKKETIERARRIRKLLGGTMRQAGILAAPAIVALNTMIDRLQNDHETAAILAREICRIPFLTINMKTVQTNMVYVDISQTKIKSEDFVSRLKQYNIEMLVAGPYYLRLVTHRHVCKEDVPRIVAAIKNIVTSI